jgi:tetratricopeptide (TPR) repeat protein
MSETQPLPVRNDPVPPPSTERRSLSLLAYVGVGLVALLVRALYLYQLRGSLSVEVLIGDGRAYDAWAWRVASGDWIGSTIFYQAPLYPYLLAVLYWVGGHEPWIVRIVQAGVGAASCVLLAHAGRRFFSLAIGVIAGVLLALYPPAVFFDGLVQKASLELFLTTLLLALLGEFLVRRQWTWIFAAGVALGALALSRENSRLLYLVVAPWLWLYFRDSAPRLRALWLAAFTAGVVLAIAPVALRNAYVGGELVLTTSQLGPNFYIGNHAGASGLYEPLLPLRGDPMHEQEDATSLAAEALGRTPTPSEVSDYWLDRALSDIVGAPGAWLRLMARKWLLTWNAREVADSEAMAVYADDAPLLRSLMAVLGFGVLCPLAVLGMWATRRDWRRLALLYGLLLTTAFAIALFFVFARYRLSLVALVVLFAAAGLRALAAATRSRESRTWVALAPGAVLALVAAGVVNRPLVADRDAQVGYVNLATALIDAGRPAAAVAPLRRAIALQPDFAAAHMNLGVAYLTDRRLEDAQASFEEALRLDPLLAMAHYNLALVRLAQRRSVQAEKDLVAALDLDPRLVRAHVLLGRLQVGAGRIQEGTSQLELAARLSPGDADIRRDLARARLRGGDVRGAAAALEETIRLVPDGAADSVRLAWILATAQDESVRDGQRAIELVAPLAQTRGAEDPIVLDTLAAAYADVGRFEEAVALASRAEQIARDAGDEPLVEAVAARRSTYAAGKVHTEPPQKAMR